jgi:hypothetical protein
MNNVSLLAFNKEEESVDRIEIACELIARRVDVCIAGSFLSIKVLTRTLISYVCVVRFPKVDRFLTSS